MEFLQIPMVTRRLVLKLTQQQKLAPAAAPMMLDLRLSGGPGLVPGEPEHSDRSGQEWVLEEDWMKPQSQVDRFLPKTPWLLWSSATFLYLWEGTLNCGPEFLLPALSFQQGQTLCRQRRPCGKLSVGTTLQQVSPGCLQESPGKQNS